MSKISDKKYSYEQAYEELEKIVTRMEEEEPALDELVGLYEKGNELLKVCQKRLEEAALRLKQVEETEDLSLSEFPVDETSGNS